VVTTQSTGPVTCAGAVTVIDVSLTTVTLVAGVPSKVTADHHTRPRAEARGGKVPWAATA
jgi:hypothetical protein